jgi:hypothetical protein
MQVIGALCFTMRKNGVRFLLGEQLAKVEVVKFNLLHFAAPKFATHHS